MNLGDIEIRADNTDLFKKALAEQIVKGLEMVGLSAEGHAKRLVPVDTGNLRNSITHVVDMGGKDVYIGTNTEYAAYVELGTGVYYAGGRTGGWKYKDAEGKWHFTYGQRPRPYLKPAATQHNSEYKKLMESALRS